MAVLSSADVAVFGVSKDSAKSHQNFTEKQGLNFPLLLDTEGELLENYGVWREKKKTMAGPTWVLPVQPSS